MALDLKKEIKEIAAIAKSCPEDFRLKCFEILLNDALMRAGHVEEKPDHDAVAKRKPGGHNKQFEAFCKQNSLSEAVLSGVFDFGSDEDFIQVSDFKQATKAKQQVVIALLSGIRSLHATGIGTVGDDGLRKLSEKHHVYDRPNFATHMKNYKKYFNPSTGGGWKLTPVGLVKAAEVINSLGGEGTAFAL